MIHRKILFRKFNFGNFHFYYSDVSSCISEIKFVKPRKRSFRKVEHVQLQKFYFENFDLSTNQNQWCQTSRVVSHTITI